MSNELVEEVAAEHKRVRNDLHTRDMVQGYTRGEWEAAKAVVALVQQDTARRLLSDDVEDRISQAIGKAEYVWVPRDVGNYNASRLAFCKHLGKAAANQVRDELAAIGIEVPSEQ